MSRRDESRTIGVYVRYDVIAALEAEGDRQNRTLSNMAGQALEDWCLARGFIKRNRGPIVVARSSEPFS